METLASNGEAEQYYVRILNPIDARFGQFKDDGIKLVDKGGVNDGKIIGAMDGQITLREKYQEVIEFKNRSNYPVRGLDIKMTNNIGTLATDYYSTEFALQLKKFQLRAEETL